MVTTPSLQFMQKVKHHFQVANQEISSGNVYMIQNSWRNCFTLFDRNSCWTFKLSTACSTLNLPVVIQTRLQSRNQINTHTEHLVQKHNNFLSLNRSYLVLDEGNKKEKLTESLCLMVKITRRLNDNMTLVLETSHKQNHCWTHKGALNEKPTDSPQWFFIHSSI